MKNFLSSSLNQSAIFFLSSPLPDVWTLYKNNQVTTLDIWKPNISLAKTNVIQKPIISAQSAITYDLIEEKVLFEKDSNKKVPMASLTKVMTAIVAIENKRDDDRYIVYSRALVGENSMGLSASEILNLEELLYGLILPSGNDAAETLAHNYAGGREQFIKAMNNKAKSLGLSNTHFNNPSGLEGDGNQYATAHDLLVITRYALLNYPLFRKVVSTVEYSIPQSPTHGSYYLVNDTNLLTSYIGVKGVKTGYTPEAGLCLVTYLEYRNHKIIAVLLGSSDRRAEMKELLDYSLKTLGVDPPPHE